MTPAPVRYTRADVCDLSGLSAPTLKNLVRGRVIRKRAKGTGNYLEYSLDDVVKAAIAKTLLGVGVDVSNVREMFAAIDKPTLFDAQPWAYLRTPERIVEGAWLCLIIEHPILPANTGAVSLMTTEGKRRITEKSTKVIAIDVNTLITEIEARAGVQYGQL